MPIDSSTLLNWPFPDIEHTYTQRDAMLYALGVGLGDPAGDPRQLRFVYEAGMAALPSLCVVLGTPGFWIKDPATGITWQKVLHGEQGFKIHKPLPPAATVMARNRVAGLLDKGEGKGTLIFVERDIRDKASGDMLATLTSTYFCRADGGCGGSTLKEAPKPAAPPQRPADRVTEFTLDGRAHLIYRLSGDYNPIHADPTAAKSAGFERPIFHGLGSLGVAAQILLGTECGWNPDLMRSMSARFTSPVFPGETIRVHAWRESAAAGTQVFFRCEAVERGVVVLDNGAVIVAAAA
jgi:acyl dehydratase